jgi:hypothetical protein
MAEQNEGPSYGNTYKRNVQFQKAQSHKKMIVTTTSPDSSYIAS